MELTDTIVIGALFRNRKVDRLWRVRNIFVDERGIVRIKTEEEENDVGEPRNKLFRGDELRALLGENKLFVRQNTDEEAEKWARENFNTE